MILIKLSDLFEKPISGEWGSETTNSDGVKVIRTTNFTNVGRLDLSKEVAVRNIDKSIIASKKLIPGDIIIEKSGGSPTQPVGRVVFFDINHNTYLCNNFTSILRAKRHSFPKYLLYILLYLHKLNIVSKYQNKTTGIINLKLNDYLQNIEIPLPPIETQKKIADVLDKAQELIDKRKEQIVLLDDFIRSVFINMFGDPVSNPKDWKQCRIDDVYSIIDGDRGVNYPKESDFSDRGYCLFLNTGNVTRDGFNFDDLKFITIDKDRSLRKGKVQKGDIILTTRGTVGNIVHFDNAIPYDVVRINSGMVLLRNTDNSISNVYFCELFKNNEMSRKIKSFLSGTAQPQLPITNLKKINIILPPIEYQNNFIYIAQQAEQQKRLMKKSLTEMENNFNSIMQRAFRGELF